MRRTPGLIRGYAGPRDPLGLPDEMMVKGELVINPQFEWAGGGFATSPLDLARWGRVLYAGTAGGGVFRSKDAGGTWSAVNTGLPSLGVRALALDASGSTTVYAGLDFASVWQASPPTPVELQTFDVH